MVCLCCWLLVLAPSVLFAGEVLVVAPDVYAQRRPTEADPEQAAKLLAEAKRAAEGGQVSVALQLASRALLFDPDEPTCRNVLGYAQTSVTGVGHRWLTSFQKKQIERGLVWDANFGWIKSDLLPRYQAGERRNGRRWMSVADDAQLHATIEDGWRVRTDHFQVTTNHSLEAAAAIGAELEQVFQVWRQLFAGYYLGGADVRARFAGTRSARGRSKPFNVFYHRDKAGYVAHLRHKQPRIDITEGIYFADVREAHFFAKAAEEERSEEGFHLPPAAVHEAVHQLFQESKRARREVGEKHSNWAVEGVACYFESLRPVAPGQFEIGGFNAGRLPHARYRLVNDRYLVPLEEMVSLGRVGLQQRDDVSRLYGQAAAVVTFLMHAEDGQRRESFVAYLEQLYAGKAREGALAASLGEPLTDLQLSYHRWLASPR